MTDAYLTPYEMRAGVTERPANLIEPSRNAAFEKVAEILRRTTTVNTFYADISEFQPVVTGSYSYPMIAFRADNGGRRDNHAAANWNFIRNSSRIQVALAYIVYIPGQNGNVMARLKSLFGSKPPAKLAVMVDMESGYQFAGPGNHSYDANNLLNDLAAWFGDRRRVVAYANRYDFGSNWPQIASWVKKVTASYGSSDPRTWGWQYFGGMTQYGSPGGYPRSVSPFGSWVDLNVIHRSIAQVKADLGMVAPPKPPTPTPPPKPRRVKEMLFYQVDRATVPAGAAWPGVFIKAPGSKPEHVLDNESAYTIGAQLGVPYGTTMPKVTYAQHAAWAAENVALLAPHPDSSMEA